MNLAPIILFVYNRPDHTLKTLEALAVNKLANQSDLFIYADGPKDNITKDQLEEIKQTREVIKSKNWCKTVTIIESEKNKGLAASIISGVTDIVHKYDKVIVLEDDIITGKYFLEFMNTALDKYENNKNVWHITGWRDPVKKTSEGYSYFYPTMDCWGWATWADRWKHFKKDALYYKNKFSDEMIFHFNIEGSEPGNWGQIEDNLTGKMNTWAIFWYATLFLNKGLCLGPSKSLVKNIGLDGSGEHCGPNNKYDFNDSIDFSIERFPKEIKTSKVEYRKNILFYRKINKITMTRRIKMFIKRKRGLKNIYQQLKKILKQDTI